MRRIRKIPSGDLERFVSISADAYPGMGIRTPADRERMRRRMELRARDSRTTLYGLYDGDRLLGGLRLYDYTMNLFGCRALVGGGGSLAVSLTHKKQHVARQLMRFYFSHYRRRGAPLAVLWPFRHDFYATMGCGYAPMIYQYRVKPAELPRTGHSDQVRYLHRDDLAAVNDCYNRWVARTHGAIEETQIGCELIFDLNEDQRWVGYVVGGTVRGYLAFVFVKGLTSWLDNDIEVTQMIYDDREVLSALLHFLHTQFDQINRIRITTHDDSFHYLLRDPRDDSGHVMRSVNHQCARAGLGIMFRVLDVERFFELTEKRRYDRQSLRVGLTVVDTFLRANHGRRVVEFSRGRAHLGRRTGRAEVEIRLGISDYSSLIMGAVDLRSLHGYGLVRLSDESYLDALNCLFAVEQKPVCVTAF